MITQVAADLCQAKNIMIVCGAGLSTASGIPDFRSAKGLYSSKTVDIKLLSSKKRIKAPGPFWDNFAVFAELAMDKKPNPAHYAIAGLCGLLPIKAIVDQNVDGLNCEAGAFPVTEAHGELRSASCRICKKELSLAEVLEKRSPGNEPVCPDCGGSIRPHVVLFGDNLPVAFHKIFDDAGIGLYDYLLVVGTSMQVYPVADLKRLISAGAVFDLEAPQKNHGYSFVSGKVEETLPALVNAIKEIRGER
jgi:NAD-dependent deacetylase